MDRSKLRRHAEAALAFCGLLVVLAGSIGAGLSLLVGTVSALSALKSAPVLASLGPLVGLALMPAFYLVAVVIALWPAAIAGALFFLAAASSLLNRVPVYLVPLLCAGFGHLGANLANLSFGGAAFTWKGGLLGSLLGFVSGAALFWLPPLRPLSDHLRRVRASDESRQRAGGTSQTTASTTMQSPGL
ncbi:hypothetical protein [Hydrogenophaga intermedia]|uniref:hypothetical protein n=1 Tax=Hydrogenophaga intermedia TaxID=65786 RepID=UPI0020439805|nr:hypothetical protein [Hydrogenophaga intermedia]MCM3562514.1 hypothetical protein [Hydrogenophaga intermedia]